VAYYTSYVYTEEVFPLAAVIARGILSIRNRSLCCQHSIRRRADVWYTFKLLDYLGVVASDLFDIGLLW